MEGKWREWIKKVSQNMGKEKKIAWENIGFSKLVIIVLAGIFLMILSFPQEDDSKKIKGKKEPTEVSEDETKGEQIWNTMARYSKEQEEKVEEILSSVEGVGAVDVMVTLAASEEKITLKDSQNTTDITQEKDSNGGSRIQNNSSLREENILIEKDDSQEPYIIEIQSPEIEGIVVVAQGAGSGAVNAEIIEAIVALFPIEAHKIKVMRMK